jgi:hypothetical protein
MGVEFEENNFAPRNFSAPPPKLAGWLIKSGIVKDVTGANMLQIIAAVIFFALAALFAFN